MDNNGGKSSGNEDARKKGKKICPRHSREQIQRLEAYFKECPHPSESQRQQLSQELKLESAQIRFWFQNKRTQSKTKEDKNNNLLLRGENEHLQSANEAMLEALQNVLCPDCGGPPLDREDRQHYLQRMRFENARLTEYRDKLASLVPKHLSKRPIVGDSFAYGPSNPSNLLEPSSSLGRPIVGDSFASVPRNPSNLLEPSSSLGRPIVGDSFASVPRNPSNLLEPSSSLGRPIVGDSFAFAPSNPSNLLEPSSSLGRPIVGDSFASVPMDPSNILEPSSSLGRPIVGNSFASGPRNPSNLLEPSSSLGPPTSQTIQPQPLSEMDISLLSETAASAVEELKRLFFTEESCWVQSAVDGTYVIDSQSYEKFSHAAKHFRRTSAHVESSKAVTVVPIEATNLIEMFLDSEKWEELFPTIVSKAKTIHELRQDNDRGNCDVLQVMWEQLHILSPLVPPREFMIARCCQEIDNGLWIIADVSHNVSDFDFVKASCYKRPSGCLIQTLPNDHSKSKVTWIEHVEVDHKLDAHKIYREILRGGSGYGAGRWIVALERMCERMALSSGLTLPASDWSEVIATGEGRRSVMKVGERMLKLFNEMLTMSGKVDFPKQSICGVRVSVRVNQAVGQPSGLVVSAASSLSIPLTPLQVHIFLRNLDTRPQWDVLSRRTVVSEISRTVTGSSETNCLTILRAHPTEEHLDDMMMLQDCYMDALGGMIVYAPMDIATMKHAVSGAEDPSRIPILPSGFIISSDGRRSTAEDGGTGTLLTVAFQILVSGKTDRSREVNERTVNSVNTLMSATVQRIKGLLNCPQ